METLHDVLKTKTAAWQSGGRASDDYPVIAEILEWAWNPDGSGFVLRAHQFQAFWIGNFRRSERPSITFTRRAPT